jgi:hypothetical protein
VSGLNVGQELLKGGFVRRGDVEVDRRGPEGCDRGFGQKAPGDGAASRDAGQYRGGGPPDFQEVIGGAGSEDHEEQEEAVVAGCAGCLGCGVARFVGFCAALRGAEEHVADPGSGETAGDPGEEGIAL